MSKNKLVPLSRVVSAAIVDTYSDIGVTQHRYSHWAARGLQDLIGKNLRLPIRRVLLPINRSSMTATLPIDFEQEVFVGYINRNKRVPIFLNRELINSSSIQNDECKCKICGGNNNIEDLNFSYTSELSFKFNGTSYEEIFTKKIDQFGNYWLIKRTPYLDTDNIVKFKDTKDFLNKFDLKECGCLDDNKENIDALKRLCPEMFKCNYTDRSCTCSNDYGGYKIFEEEGLIQLEASFKEDCVYVEYNAFMPKINGEYQVPKVAFETLVNWTKFKAVENRPNVSLSERNWTLQMYKDAKSNMAKKLGRAKLSNILKIATRLPKFDISK